MSAPRVRRRLTSWYALSTLGLLLVALLAMRSYARHALRREHDLATARAAELVRSFFRAELREYGKVEFTVGHVAMELVFGGMWIDFLRPDGRVFATARRPANEVTPAPLAERTVALDTALAPGWSLRLRFSVAALRSAQDRIDQLTLVAIPLAALLSAIVAWFMTGWALAPVGAMARAATHLGTQSSSRLPITDPGDEFGRLGLAFNGLLERLEGVVHQQRRFLADAAHELRTPIARMLAESEVRLAAPASGEDRESLEHIRGELQRTSRLVDELLHLAQSDAGALTVEREALFLDDVVADAITPWQPELVRRGITLDASLLEEARVAGDRALLQRLVGSLLENAVRYTPDGGRIAVGVRSSGDAATLTIEDSGIGVPEHERSTIFERFTRGTEARRNAPEGSGLGLAIAAGIARQHGATITVGDSALGGARFAVTIPAA